MNAIPELKPISIAVVVRPTFDNACIASFRQWVAHNSFPLAKYYKQLTDALPAEERLAGSDDDFDVWLLVQYDIEFRKHMARELAL